MFKGPAGPQSGRTSRTQAEKMGTTSEGFKEGPAYDICKGHPTGKGFPAGEYKERVPEPTKGSEPMDIPAPFTTSI